MKKQLISPRRLAEAAADAAFKIITADIDKRRPQPGEKAGDIIRSVIQENIGLAQSATIDQSVRAARLAEASLFPDYVEPVAPSEDMAAADMVNIINELASATNQTAENMARAVDSAVAAVPGKSNITDEHMEQIKTQFLESIRNKPAPAPEPKKLHELLVEPENPPKDIYYFAHGLAEAASWNRAAVQLWLNYLDAIEYDYMGLGMKNMIVLLPSIVETVRITESNNAGLSSAARMALVRRTLDKKTLSAVNRAQIAGNRVQRRAQKSPSDVTSGMSGINAKHMVKAMRGSGKIHP